jgi:hypothetical protein
MDNYQEEEYISDEEMGIPKTNDESTSVGNIYRKKLSKSRLDAMRFDPIPVAGTVDHYDDEEQDPYVIQMKKTLEEKNTRNMYAVHHIMGKGKWGFPLSQANCYDLDRYFQLVKPGQKAFANTRAGQYQTTRYGWLPPHIGTIGRISVDRLSQSSGPSPQQTILVSPGQQMSSPSDR